MNHMAGESLPNYRLLNLRYGERFVPQDMDQVQVLPSGLTAPVRLVVGNLAASKVRGLVLRSRTALASRIFPVRFPEGGLFMTRVTGFLVALLLVGFVSTSFASDKTKSAKGTVKTVAADSIIVTDAAGKDWTFAIDAKSKLIAAGGSHKTAEIKSHGQVSDDRRPGEGRREGGRQVSRVGRRQDARGRSARALSLA